MARLMFLRILAIALAFAFSAEAQDLSEIQKRGTLRHLGIPYANFVTGSGDGFSVDLAKGFAAHLGVAYEYVETGWATIIQDLVGREVFPKGNNVELGAVQPIRGDLIANGLTIVAWREKVIRYSNPTFPTQVWLVTRSDSGMSPIRPSGDLNGDIAAVRGLLKGKSVLGMANTCLEPALYDIAGTGATPRMFTGSLNDMAGVVMQGEVETTLLDVPDALVALRKWPGKVKVVGPLSPMQNMAVGFRPDSPALREAFNAYLSQIRRDGTFRKIVEKYYPMALLYFPEFFADAAKS